jgi:hypothetical protein
MVGTALHFGNVAPWPVGTAIERIYTATAGYWSDVVIPGERQPAVIPSERQRVEESLLYR